MGVALGLKSKDKGQGEERDGLLSLLPLFPPSDKCKPHASVGDHANQNPALWAWCLEQEYEICLLGQGHGDFAFEVVWSYVFSSNMGMEHQLAGFQPWRGGGL